MVSASGSLLAALLLAAVAVGLIVRGYRQHRRRAALLRRLRAISQTTTGERDPSRQLLRERDDPAARWTERIARFTPPLRDMEQLLEQAGLPWKRSHVVRLGLLLGLSLGVVALVLAGSPAAGLAGLGSGLLLPRLYVLRRRAKRVRAFEEQLPDAIDLLGRSIRAGHAVTTGLRMVAEEADPPIATEFRRVFEEQRYGLPFEESLLSLTRRIDLIDLRVMVVAVLVQREVGGNLAEILDKLSRLIRTRFTLRRQLRVHTAQGRLSGYVLSLLPLGVGLAISLFDPEYMALLFVDPLGRAVLGAALTLQLIGYLWIWRILKLDI